MKTFYHADYGDNHYHGVYHCEQMREIKDVKWLDLDKAIYGVIVGYNDLGVICETHSAKKIILKGKVFYVNPIEDNDKDETLTVEKELENV